MWLLTASVACALLFSSVVAHGDGSDDEEKSSSSDSSNTGQQVPRVLLLSIDGFRYGHIEMMREKGKPMENFEKLANEGVYASMKPQFPSETFVNHVSMITGLYPAVHGIVGNVYYDASQEVTFDAARKPSQWFDERLCSVYGGHEWGPEPLWYTNERQRSNFHPNRRSGIYLWPCAYRFRGTQPSVYESQYNVSVPFRERLDRVLGWFLGEGRPDQSGADETRSAETEPVNLAAVYYEHVDEVSHEYGPDSQELQRALAQLDADIGYLLRQASKMASQVARLDGVKRVKRHEETPDWLNLVLVSDHGFAQVDSEDEKHTIKLSDLLQSLAPSHRKADVKPSPHTVATQFSSYYEIDLVLRRDGEPYTLTDQQLTTLNAFHPAIRVYRLNSAARSVEKKTDGNSATSNFEAPEEFRLSTPSYSPVKARLRDLLILAQPGYLLENDYSQRQDGAVHGVHGYNQSEPTMQAIFIARGPAFRKNYRVSASESFENVDLYPLLCTVLQLRDAPSNGSLARVSSLLADAIRNALNAPPQIESPHSTEQLSSHTQMLTVITYCVFVVLTFIVAVLIVCGAVLRRNLHSTTVVRMHAAELNDRDNEVDNHHVTVRGKPSSKDVIRMHSRRSAERQKLMDDVDDDELHT